MLHAAAPPGGGNLQRQQLLSIWLGTARGMQHLHASRVVHRGEFYPSSARFSLASPTPSGGADSCLFTHSWAVTSFAHTSSPSTARGTFLSHNCLFPSPPPDLKSANLLLDDFGSIKIGDFGLSRLCQTEAVQKAMTGALGTYQWMAPEVLTSQRYSEKADVYSFGMVRSWGGWGHVGRVPHPAWWTWGHGVGRVGGMPRPSAGPKF